MIEHDWRVVQFVFGTWIECACGFQPQNHEEFDKHSKENNLDNGEGE